MKKLYDERKEYQRDIIEYLKKENGYRVRKNSDFDPKFAIDRGVLFDFLNASQPDVMDELRKIFKDETEERIVAVINETTTTGKGSLLETLKDGIEISNRHLDLMYTKPATSFNKTLLQRYDDNILSVMEEVYPSPEERVDLVIFLNGIAIIAIELKCNTQEQSYRNAIEQYRTKRNPKTRLFLFKAGCLVYFAMDLNEVYMTTKLEKEATRFLPFNMGSGEGVDSGAGNPLFSDKLSVSYMWEDVLTKDSILDLISKFIFIEKTEEIDETTGKKKRSETIIFPRYHQRDLIRKLLESVKEHGSNLNYLVEHSAGSGKTNSIAWLVYRLASLHDNEDQIIFDQIIVITDRVVVERQLQKALRGIDHQEGLIRMIDEKCTSADLAKELKNNTKIVASTIQKFPYVVDTVKNLKDRRFALIIDEAHSSTSGRNMRAVRGALGSDDKQGKEVDDYVNEIIEKTGKLPNVSAFAFTATPKDKTLCLFGTLNAHGQHEAFHLYSMKQAIEEGYILDVLQNFTEYETMCRLNKQIKDDPKMKTDDAKKQIARFIDLHEENIAQRVEIVVEHFKNVVMNELGGTAKAMVVTPSRKAAVRYYQAFKNYIKRKKYVGIDALVAFSGKIKLDEDQKEYSESGINGFNEAHTQVAFDGDEYNVLIVANKYQTGFDQKKLCAMYVFRNLRGVDAVQTYSRLNRIHPQYEDKKTFILDFVNKYEDIQRAFAPFYTATILSGNFNPNRIYDLAAEIDAYGILDPLDVERFNELLFKDREGNITKTERNSMIFLLNKVDQLVKTKYANQPVVQREIRMKLRNFVRFYEFLQQASCFKDVEIHKKYVFISYLTKIMNTSEGGPGFDLKGKIRADRFQQKKGKTHVGETLISKPIIKLPSTNGFSPREEKIKRLSEIIEEINSRMGKKFDVDVGAKAILQITDFLMKSPQLKESAKNNTEEDFAFPFYSGVDDALIKGLTQNQEFFTMLLDNPELKQSVLGDLIGDVYNALRENP